MIWKRKITLEALNAMGEGNINHYLTMRYLILSVPVNPHIRVYAY